MSTGGKKGRKDRADEPVEARLRRRRRADAGRDAHRLLEPIDRSLGDPDEFRLPSRLIREWLWVVLLVAGLVAFVLAFLGGSGPFDFWRDSQNAVRLFPSGFPGYDADATRTYAIAAHLAALVTVSATAILVAVALWGRMERLRARFARGHVVVVGLGEKGLRIGRGLRGRHRSTICLTLDPTGDAADDLRARGARVIAGDATQDVSLRAAAVDRADVVVCACGADAVNAQIAARVIRRRAGSGRAVGVYAHIANPELAHVLRTTALRLEDTQLHFFNIYATWARALLRDGPLGSRLANAGAAPRIAVIGTSDLARALVVRACRRWHFGGRADGSGRMTVVVVGADSGEFCEGIAARYPALPRTSELVPLPHSASVQDPSALAQLRSDVDAVYVCLPDDGEALGVALQARYQLGAHGPEVLVPSSPWTRGLSSLLVSQEERITIVRYPLADPLDLLRDTVRESLARAVHATYLEGRRDEEDWQQRPADVEWEDLDEAAREASRRHVDHMLEQLEAMWYEVAPLFDWDEPAVELDPEQVEVIARFEHERWCREQLAQGLEYGPTRTDGHHPLLVPWSDLPEVDAELDRDLARNRPAILARAGYALVHMPERETLARLVHSRYAERRGPGDVAAWTQLSEEERDLNRSAVDDIAMKLLEAGYRLERAPAAVDQIELPPDVVERLAEHEHERWCRIRSQNGWSYGSVRDEAQRLHPDLVPWEQLSEDRRQLDREQVLEIPSLLASVRFGAVRLEEPPRAASVPRALTAAPA